MIQSVDRALRVLAVLSGARRMSLGEIAGQLGLPPSTVHGIVRTLLAHGMVLQERDSSRYRLGPGTLRLGNVYLETLELRARIAPWADDLAARVGFAVRTGVPLQQEVVVVHHAVRPDGSRQMPEVGIVIPAHTSALGKVFLAYDESVVLSADGAELVSMTGDTITEPAVLQAQLAEIRAGALATEVEEAVLGECGLAAPIADLTGTVVGAVALVIPRGEWPVSSTCADSLRAVARTTSRELGAPRWPPP